MARVLGLDLGTVTLGVAISRTGIIATGYEEFRFPERQWQIALQETMRIAKLEEIGKIALGLPLNMSGTESPMSQNARAFRHMLLKAMPDVEVILVDERQTTKEAELTLLEGDLSRSKRKRIIDKIAAQAILERYLESGRR